MKIFVSKESTFSNEKRVVYSIYEQFHNNKEFYKEECIKVSEDEKKIIPFEYYNPIQSVFYKYYNGGNSIIATPTSSGKTGIIYITLLKNYQKNSNFSLIYTSPTKALIEEKYREFKQNLENNNFLKDLIQRDFIVDIKTGDYFTKKVNPKANIICSTYDSLVIALRNNLEWVYKDLIVIDEVHSILGNMGRFLPEILALAMEKNIQLLLMSATLPIIDYLENYIKPTLVISSDWRPVPLKINYLHLDNHFFSQYFNYQLDKKGLKKFQDKAIIYILEEALIKAKLGEKVIIFVPSKSLGWKFINYSKNLNIQVANETILAEDYIDDSEEDKNEDKEKEGKEYKKESGIMIAFHNADLPYDERSQIEARFREDGDNLKILVATQTLAMGVNLPADVAYVIIKGFYKEEEFEFIPSILDILQEEGRVGRFGIRPQGESFRTTWAIPYSIRRNLDKIINNSDGFIQNLLKKRNVILNSLSLILLTSLAIFKDERMVYKSILFSMLDYSEKKYITKVLSNYYDFLVKCGFWDNNNLTAKAGISLQTNIPPHFLQAFFELYDNFCLKNNKYITNNLPIEKILTFRPLIHTKNFTNFFDNAELKDIKIFKENFISYYDLSINDLKKIENIISYLLKFISIFEEDDKNINRISNSIWEYLYWMSNTITMWEKFNKPLGEYSNLYIEANYLTWTFYNIFKNYYPNSYSQELDFFKRFILGLIYGANPNISILGKIKNIGHKRIAKIADFLYSNKIFFIDNIQSFYDSFVKEILKNYSDSEDSSNKDKSFAKIKLSQRKVFYIDKELIDIFKIIEKNLSKVRK